MSGSAHVTNGGSGGMMSTAGLELPYPLVSQAKCPGTKLLGGESNVTFVNVNMQISLPVHCVWRTW